MKFTLTAENANQIADKLRKWSGVHMIAEGVQGRFHRLCDEPDLFGRILYTEVSVFIEDEKAIIWLRTKQGSLGIYSTGSTKATVEFGDNQVTIDHSGDSGPTHLVFTVKG